MQFGVKQVTPSNSERQLRDSYFAKKLCLRWHALLLSDCMSYYNARQITSVNIDLCQVVLNILIPVITMCEMFSQITWLVK